MLSHKKYTAELTRLANELASELLLEYPAKIITDSLLQAVIRDKVHTIVDNHIWNRLNYYHFPILSFTDNARAFEEVYSDAMAGEYLANNGIKAFTCMTAIYAIEADLADVSYIIYRSK